MTNNEKIISHYSVRMNDVPPHGSANFRELMNHGDVAIHHWSVKAKTLAEALEKAERLERSLYKEGHTVTHSYIMEHGVQDGVRYIHEYDRY